jgi:hypothetical protein
MVIDINPWLAALAVAFAVWYTLWVLRLDHTRD